MFASLFSATGLAATFDDAVIADARTGRVYRPFATLAATELGLCLTRPDGHPIGKAPFLKLAADYRAEVKAGRTAGFRAWGQRAAIGCALDLIAVTLDPSAPVIGDAAAWEAVKPARKVAVKTAVKTVALPDSATVPVAAKTVPALGVALADAFPVVLDAIKAGALSAVQRALIVTALAESSSVGAAVLASLNVTDAGTVDALPLLTLTDAEAAAMDDMAGLATVDGAALGDAPAIAFPSLDAAIRAELDAVLGPVEPIGPMLPAGVKPLAIPVALAVPANVPNSALALAFSRAASEHHAHAH